MFKSSPEKVKQVEDNTQEAQEKQRTMLLETKAAIILVAATGDLNRRAPQLKTEINNLRAGNKTARARVVVLALIEDLLLALLRLNFCLC